MQSLPNLTICLLSLSVASLTGSLSDLTPAARGDDAAQPQTQKADTPEASPSPPAGSSGDAALELLQQARQTLYERTSVQARIHQAVSIGPRRFRGEGKYVAGRFPRLRLALAIDVGGTKGDLLEVCDGTILWTVRQIDSGSGEAPDVQVARTVINDVTQALDQTMDVPETVLVAGLGVGGLPALLASLERSMTFEAIRVLEEDGKSFHVIQGRWSDAYLNRLTGSNANAELPAYVPDHVRIYFDAHTKFPTRILYLRRTEPQVKTFVALLSLDFTDVVLDATVDEELFRYTPGPTVKVQDRTGEYLRMIDDAAKKGRADAAVRADGSVPLGDQ